MNREFVESRLRFILEILERLPKNVHFTETDGFSKFMLHFLQCNAKDIHLDSEHLEESFARIFGCKKEEVLLIGDDVYIQGSLYYQNYDKLSTYRLVAKYQEYQNEISKIVGYMHPSLKDLTNADGIIFPQATSGPLFLTGIESPQNMTSPVIVGGDCYMTHFKTAINLRVPKIVMGNMFLSAIETMEGLNFPEYVEGRCFLDSLAVDLIDWDSFPNPLTYEIECRDGEVITPSNVALYRKRVKGN